MQSIYFCNMLDVGLVLYIPDAVGILRSCAAHAVSVNWTP
jgi:hypothetical protein